MKKLLSMILSVFLLTGLLCSPAYASDDSIPVYIGDKTVNGILIEDTTFVPFDTFCYVMGADTVTWNPETDVVSAYCRGIVIESKEWASYIEANGRCFYSGL